MNSQNVQSKQTSESKRFSVMMRNIDFNAYRAFKLVNEDEKKTKKNPHEMLTGQHNLMRFPFGLKEKRFRWQTSKNLGERVELSGTIFKKFDTKPARWDDLMQRTSGLPERRGSLANK